MKLRELAKGASILSIAVATEVIAIVTERAHPETYGHLYEFGAARLVANGLIYAAILFLAFLLWYALVLAALKLGRQRKVLAAFISVLTIVNAGSYVRFQLFGAPNYSFPYPFRGGNMFVAPRGVYHLPKQDVIDRVGARLENDRYRCVFLAAPKYEFVSRYLSQQWGLRAVEGYGPAVPSGLANFPWPNDVFGARQINFPDISSLDWPLLAYLNVKFAVSVDDALYFNINSDTDFTGFEAIQLKTTENPYHVVPRAFLARRLMSGKQPGLSPTIYDGDIPSATLDGEGRRFPEHSIVTKDGFQLPRDPQKVSMTAESGIDQEFDDTGPLVASFAQDSIDLRFIRSARERLIILNETYDPKWVVEGDPGVKVIRVNSTMRGVIVPAGYKALKLKYQSFAESGTALVISLSGLLVGVAGLFSLRFIRRS